MSLNLVLLNTLIKFQIMQEEVFENKNIFISGIVGLRSDCKFLLSDFNLHCPQKGQ